MSKIISWRSRSRSKSEEKPAKYIPAAIIPSVAFIANPSISTELLKLNVTENFLQDNTWSVEDIEINQSNEKLNDKPTMHKKAKSISVSREVSEKSLENSSFRSRPKSKKKPFEKPRPEIDDYEIKDSKRQIEIANGLHMESFPNSTTSIKTPEIKVHDHDNMSFKEENKGSLHLSNNDISVDKYDISPSYLHLVKERKHGFHNEIKVHDHDNMSYKEENKSSIHLSNNDLSVDKYDISPSYPHLVKERKQGFRNGIGNEQMIEDAISNMSEEDIKNEFRNLATELSLNEEEKSFQARLSVEKSLSDRNMDGEMDPLTTISNEALSIKSRENIVPNPSISNSNNFIVSESPFEMEFIQKNMSPKSRKKQMKAEIRLLHDTVYRLNMALSEKISENEQGQFIGKTILPGKGPVPSWIMNTKYLAPLFIAHDKKCRAQTLRIQKMQVDINNFEKEIRQIIKENERLHLKLQENQKGGPVSNQSDWQVIIQQAKLVIEENHLLLEELEIQQKKFQITEKNTFTEIAQLKKALLSVTSERDAFDEEIKTLTRRIAELKGNTLPINALNSEIEDGDSKRQMISSNQLKLFESEIANLKEDKRNLEREIETLKEKGKKDEKKVEKYKKIIDSEKNFRDYFNNVLEKSDEVLNERNYLMDKIESLNKEIVRIENRITVEIDCRTKLNIGEHEIRKFRQDKEDSAMNHLYSIESWLDLLLQKYVDSINLSRDQENEIVKSLNLLKEKDNYIDECLHENEAMEQKLENLLKNAITEY